MFAKRLENLHPYIPGEQPDDKYYIKLNANENPYPPPQDLIKTAVNFLQKNAELIRLYPDPESLNLRKAIAAMLNESGGLLTGAPPLPFRLSENEIFCGNGSDEVLSFIFYAFFDSDMDLILPEYTYSFYPVYADYYGISLKKIPLAANWMLDYSAMIKAAGLHRAATCSGMIFANPNAPTGIALSVKQIEAMLQKFPKNKIMLVDEAYADFNNETALALLAKYKNLIIVRTFSKSMGFAGMRLGYCLADADLIKGLTKAKNSFNHFPVDVFSQYTGIAACKNWKYYGANAKKISIDRDNFSTVLRRAGWTVLPSAANFVMTKKNEISGFDLYTLLKKDGFLVRHFDAPAIRDYVRISIGTSEQMEQLVSSMIKISSGV